MLVAWLKNKRGQHVASTVKLKHCPHLSLSYPGRFLTCCCQIISYPHTKKRSRKYLCNTPAPQKLCHQYMSSRHWLFTGIGWMSIKRGIIWALSWGYQNMPLLYGFLPHSVLEILLSKEADSDAYSVPTKMGMHNDSYFWQLSTIFFLIFSSPHANQCDIKQQGDDVQIPLSEFKPWNYINVFCHYVNDYDHLILDVIIIFPPQNQAELSIRVQGNMFPI